MINLKNSDEEILFFYHHRYSDNNNYKEIIRYCDLFAELYNNEKRKCHIVIIMQKIISDNNRRIYINAATNNCILCEFYTTNVWSGDRYVSGETDDDLLIEMFKRLYSMNLLDNIDFLEDYHINLNTLIEYDLDGLDKLIIKRLNMTDGQYLYLWGAGKRGIPLLNYLLKRNIKVSAIIDNDIEKQNISYLPVPVIPYTAVTDDKVNILISVKNETLVEDIKKQILETNRDANILSLVVYFQFLKVFYLGSILNVKSTYT